jgi:NDP-sugar pyrophosphorylase family protein
MQALILAGGRGTRLHPYTTVIPKPLMPVGDYPILEIIIRQLKLAGVDEVIMAVGYMSQLFQAFFQEGERYDLKRGTHCLGNRSPWR